MVLETNNTGSVMANCDDAIDASELLSRAKEMMESRLSGNNYAKSSPSKESFLKMASKNDNPEEKKRNHPRV